MTFSKLLICLSIGTGCFCNLFAQQSQATLTWDDKYKENFFFYNEANWRNSSTDERPVPNTLRANQDINAQLLITDTSGIVGGNNGVAPDIWMGSGRLVLRDAHLRMHDSGKITFSRPEMRNLVLENSTLEAAGLVNASVRLKDSAHIRLRSDNPLQQSVIDIAGTDVSLYFEDLRASEVVSKYVDSGLITVNSQPVVIFNFDASAVADASGSSYSSNVLVTQYYGGCVIRTYSHDDNSAIMTGFAGSNGIGINDGSRQRNFTIGFHRGNSETVMGDGSLMKSFRLKKGYSVMIAEAHKSSKSQNQGNAWELAIEPYWEIKNSRYYAAIERDLFIDLAADLSGKINFVKVTPWNYVRKKGLCTSNKRTLELNGDWYYNWWSGKNDTADFEYIPMIKTRGQAANNGVWDQFCHKNIGLIKNPVSLLAINEPLGDDQGMMPEYRDAVEVWPRFLETGTRLGSPAPKEAVASYRWLDSVMMDLNSSGYRIDFVALHWYDWGGWGNDQNPNQSATAIFNRFKLWLDNMHKRYNRPLWITEFNANRYRIPSVQEGFLKLALPYLESLDFVERYSYFEPAGGLGSFFEDDEKTILSPVGRVYRDHVSRPAIGADVLYDKAAGDKEFVSARDITKVNYDLKHGFSSNAAKGRITFAQNSLIFDPSLLNENVCIYTLNGKLFKSAVIEGMVDISNFPRGVYMARVQDLPALRFSVIK